MSSSPEMPKAYEPSAVEDKWYPFWESNGLFRGRPNPAKKPYSIVIPPPNVTGILTMGHVLNNTLQDILARWRRMEGHEVCWFPGTDHAGIATESRVEKFLRETENAGRDTLGREEFIKRVWDWKGKYGGTIIKQLRKLGASCDWERERFTMDEGLSQAVKESFVQLYRKGYIKRGRRMINWCPVSKTALSDEEVVYKEVKGKFYHFKYPLTDGSGFLTVATTRPETMLGDTAVAVHPEDPRYKHLIGKTVDLPLTGRRIPVIGDLHADPEKGTGCVKITPAHDPNDFQVGERNNLEFINVFNANASMNAKAGKDYQGLDRFECRKKVVKDIEALGLLDKIEDIVHSVGYSERGDVPSESMISEQWFVDMKELAKPAIQAVKDGTIKFHPERWSKTYFHWMENIKDWCISRQIWWGHRIPAWYNEKDEVYVGVEPPKGEGWRQDEDVLDTWFSSWLWPFSIMGWPEKTPEQDYFYPTNDLVTGPDIIFFWVARMIMAGYEFKGRHPFSNVYFTSIIRDEQGRKLSKSLGNSPDPLDVIATYGADALRFSIIYIAPVGMDIRYNNEKCEIGRNFANKLWNACRFRMMQGPVTPGFDKLQVDVAKLTPDEKWILDWLDESAIQIRTSLQEFKFHQSVHEVYELVWSSFCDWFIESSKQRLYASEESKKQTLAVLDFALWRIIRLLHPFMPFVTEELAHQMGFLKDGESVMYAPFPKSFKEDGVPCPVGGDDSVLTYVEDKFQLVRAGRNLRAAYEIPPGKKLEFYIKAASKEIADFLSAEMGNLKSLLNASEVKIGLEDYDRSTGAAPSLLVNAGSIYLPLKGVVDIEAETAKLEKQQKELSAWIQKSEAKLSNQGFVAKAPPKVIEEARTHLAGLKEKLVRVEETLATLK